MTSWRGSWRSLLRRSNSCSKHGGMIVVSDIVGLTFGTAGVKGLWHLS